MTFLNWLIRRPVFQYAGISIILNLMVEFFSRRSIVAGLGFVVSDPLIFLCNAAIIMLTLSVTLAFKRRYFALILVSVAWIGLGVMNYVLLFFRTTPLAAIDFQIIKSVESIISMYLSVIEIVLILTVVSGVVAGIIFAWIKTPKRKPMYLTALSSVSILLILIGSLNSFLIKEQVISSNFGNLADAYTDYGFAYCFTRSVLDRGIDEPEDFSEEAVLRLLKAINADETVVPDIKPNIIMVQLESFFDVNYLEALDFSENPIPVFTELKENYPHGFLTVPSIGAGTANTEFEILTGMSLSHFGAGEYPYKTLLQENTCESISYNLAELDYVSHAIHNHHGTFYERNVVFSNLGFDTFTSLEYMKGVEYNPLGWAKDGILTGEIMKALTQTEQRDFIFGISVQAHGKYPEKVIDEKQHITVDGIDGKKERIAFEYFVNQLYETDAFIKALIAELTTYDEPVALVLFGDHLPSLDVDNEDLSNGDRFETEYVIWNNYGLEAESQDLSAYQLSAHLLKQLGISNGILTKLHQTLADQDNYQEALELLAYDMVYGEQIAYGGESPHVTRELHMGTSDIIVNGVRSIEERAYILGDGFTEWSQVFIDEKKTDTTYIDDHILMISMEELESGADIAVAQVNDKTPLSLSNSFRYP